MYEPLGTWIATKQIFKQSTHEPTAFILTNQTTFENQEESSRDAVTMFDFRSFYPGVYGRQS